MYKATFRFSKSGIILILLISFFSGINNDSYCQYADIGNAPLEWLGEPHSVFSSEVVMSVKVPDIQGQLEYRFECVSGDGYSSQWQSSTEFKNSGLKPETKYSYIARVRRAGSSDEVIPPTGIYEVTTRRSTNTDKSRYIPEIDKAFANGEIELIPLRVTGDKDNRINFCVINRWVEGKPDSYNSSQMREEFINDAKHSFRTFIPGDEYAIDPFPEYRDFFNLFAIWWPDMPAYNWKNGLSTVDLDEIRDRLFLPWNREGKGWVSCLAMLNTDYGGGGAARDIERRIGNAMIAGRETEGFIHEFAHTAPGLPDEYTSNGVWGRGGEGSNTTLDYIADDVKWRAWIEPGTEIPTPYTVENMDKVGVFEGATHRLHHIYRPTARGCIMGAGSFAGDPDGLCPVCVQRTVCRLYMWIDPFENKYPARNDLDVSIPGKVHFSVDKIDNLSGSQKLSWFLNGKEIAGGVKEVDIVFDDTIEYRVECRMVDETEFVRPDPPYIDYPVASVEWVINKKDLMEEVDDKTAGKGGDRDMLLNKQAGNNGPGNLSVSVSEIIPSTGSYNNGSVKINVMGGKKPYSFTWSDGKMTDKSSRHFLVPGNYTIMITDADRHMKELEFEIGREPGIYVSDLEFKESGKGKVSISNPRSDYTYYWYENDIPDYVPKFPNGKFYGTGKKANGDEFKAVATVIENRGGVFIKDTAKNDFGSWIYLKVYPDGDHELPVEFSINTSQNGRHDSILIIKDQITEKIIYDDNYQFSTEEVDITWNGIIRDGYMELHENGYMDSKMKLYYSSFYPGRKDAIAKGVDFKPEKPGNYYVEACDLKTGARSANRLGVAIAEKANWDKRKDISPRDIKSSKLQMWLDANDLDADGKPDGKLFRRGSANGGRSKAGDINFHFFNYFPNKQNGKPVLSWKTIWVQSLSEEINNYQTIIMVRKESDFSSEGTAPWRELDTLIGTGNYGEKLFTDNLSSYTTSGNVWINGEKVDVRSASMPENFYIATYEFSDVMNNPFKITDGHWEGELTEVLVFNSRLTKKERRGVEEYLYRKWIAGISCL